MRRAQGALEYLIIISAVLGVAAAVVYLSSSIFSGESSTASLNACREAAAKCELNRQISSKDTCPNCFQACFDSVTGRELFAGAVDCCNRTMAEKIYPGSEGCTPIIPLNLVITTPSPGIWTGASATLTAVTDIPATCSYKSSSDAYQTMSTTGGTSHSQGLSSLTGPQVTYSVRCIGVSDSRSIDGKSVTWNVDTTPPTVSLTSPTTGVRLSDITTISATASDPESGVSKVYFNISSPAATTIIFYPDSSAPYSYTWDIFAVLNSSRYQLTAVAENNAGIKSGSGVVLVFLSYQGITGQGSCPSVPVGSSSATKVSCIIGACCKVTDWGPYSCSSSGC